MAELFSIGLYTLIIAYLGVGQLRGWAARRLLALPNERSSHTQPTPSGGGVAIVLSTLLGILLFALLNHHLSPALWAYCAGATLIAVISWYDDLYTVPNRIRFGVHSLSALLLLLGTGSLQQIELPGLGVIALGQFGYVVSFLWIVGLTNAYNFMDGIDGLAGSQAVIAGVAWALLGFGLGEPLIMALGLILAAGALGFLRYNWSPARIFMGDVGSAFLGYSFSALPLLATQPTPRLALVGLLLLWTFVFDPLFTIARRWQRGENIFQAHRSHLYQRLVIGGYSHRTVTLAYAGLTLLGALAALLWFYAQPGGLLALLAGVPTLILVLWGAVKLSEARLVAAPGRGMSG